MSDAREQEDVLRKKDRTTKNAIGLQKWDVDEDADPGSGGSGTAGRAARIAAGQKEQEEREG